MVWNEFSCIQITKLSYLRSQINSENWEEETKMMVSSNNEIICWLHISNQEEITYIPCVLMSSQDDHSKIQQLMEMLKATSDQWTLTHAPCLLLGDPCHELVSFSVNHPSLILFLYFLWPLSFHLLLPEYLIISRICKE